MELTTKATEFEPEQGLVARAQQKVARLQRYLPDLERADIELSMEPTRGVEARRIVRVNLILNGKVLLRAERRAADPNAAIDAVVDTLKEQVLRYKEMREDWRHHRRESREVEKERTEAEESEEAS